MKLTPREKDVLGRVCEGASTKEIAHSMGVTEQGVKAHISRLFMKFGVTNRAGLATKATGMNRDRRQAISDRYHERARSLGRENTQLRIDNAGLRADLQKRPSDRRRGDRPFGGTERRQRTGSAEPE